jgi:hypothetical protein
VSETYSTVAEGSVNRLYSTVDALRAMFDRPESYDLDDLISFCRSNRSVINILNRMIGDFEVCIVRGPRGGRRYVGTLYRYEEWVARNWTSPAGPIKAPGDSARAIARPETGRYRAMYWSRLPYELGPDPDARPVPINPAAVVEWSRRGARSAVPRCWPPRKERPFYGLKEWPFYGLKERPFYGPDCQAGVAA